MITGWVEKKRRSEFFSWFGEWDKRYIICTDTNVQLYTEPKHPSHIIPISTIISITYQNDTEFILETNIRSYQLRSKTRIERDQLVLFINGAMFRYKREKEEQYKAVQDDLYDYITLLRSE